MYITLCQHILCSFSVKYEPTSIKIGRIVPEETLHKTVFRMSTSPKLCACTTLGNLKWRIEPSTQQLSVRLNDFIPPALWPPNSPDLNSVDYTVWSVLQERVYRTRSRMSTNWNDAPSASGPLWVTRLLTVLLKRGVSVYALAFVLAADILSTHRNKDCVMWHIGQWLFWETITVSHVCCYSVNRSNGDKSTLNYCVNGSVWHFKFPKVEQAHTLGEVGILGTVLLRVSFGPVHAIFIEIGSYLTDKRAKNKLAQFILRHGVYAICLTSLFYWIN